MSVRRTASRLNHNGVNYALTSEQVTYRAGANANLAMKVYTDTALSSTSNGQAVFTLPAGYFTTIYNIQVQSMHPTAMTFASCSSYSLTQVTVQVIENAISGVLLGGIINGLRYATTQTAVHLMVIGV